MKKALYSILILAASTTLFSCNKDYTCACTFSNSNKNFEVTIEKVRRNDANVICQDYSQFVGNCQIK
ncbi:MAG: hypothetical protein JNJ58_02110 [Chitinophagaceae bacterium]|nr:hypothetical protein [Chitinophagaceae bacterium]